MRVGNVINYSNYSDDSIAYVYNFAYETTIASILAIVENQIELYISFICMTQPAGLNISRSGDTYCVQSTRRPTKQYDFKELK